jgi:hypothetical protein
MEDRVSPKIYDSLTPRFFPSSEVEKKKFTLLLPLMPILCCCAHAHAGRMVDAIKRQQEGSSFSLSFMSFTFEPLFLFGSLIP